MRAHGVLRMGNGSRRSSLSAARRNGVLDRLDMAASLGDVANFPGHRLEKLKGDRAGQWSVRINDQWRVCFRWDDGAAGPGEVEIVDYH